MISNPSVRFPSSGVEHVAKYYDGKKGFTYCGIDFTPEEVVLGDKKVACKRCRAISKLPCGCSLTIPNPRKIDPIICGNLIICSHGKIWKLSGGIEERQRRKDAMDAKDEEIQKLIARAASPPAGYIPPKPAPTSVPVPDPQEIEREKTSSKSATKAYLDWLDRNPDVVGVIPRRAPQLPPWAKDSTGACPGSSRSSGLFHIETLCPACGHAFRRYSPFGVERPGRKCPCCGGKAARAVSTRGKSSEEPVRVTLDRAISNIEEAGHRRLEDQKFKRMLLNIGKRTRK